MATKPLIIKDWDQGIADSPHKGLQLMKNVDIEEVPGAVVVGKQPASMFHTALEKTFTANASTNVITIPSGVFPETGVAVTVSNAGGALPAGLSAATNYFLIKVTATTAKLATTITNAKAGTAIDITGAGTGVHTVTTVNPGIITHIIQGDGFYIAQDDNGRVWYSDTNFFLLNGNTLTNPAGNGIVLFENSDASATYLLVFRNALIDVIEVTAITDRRTPSWSNGWQSLNSGATSDNSHYCLHYKGEDNIIYFCDDRYVGSIKENSGQVFDPANSATYSYTNQALDLPNGETSFWLESLGVSLFTSVSTSNKIYPWDRIADSFYLPLTVPEKNVYRMKNLGDIVYIQAGTQGNIYRTQGSSVRLFKKLPFSVTKNSASPVASPVAWGGIEEVAGKLIVGIDANSTGNDGVYIIYPDGRVVIDNQPLSGSAKVTALLNPGSSNYLMGSDGGIDVLTAARYSSYEAVIQSGLYRVATKTEKATFSTLEVVTSRVPSSGTDYVKVSYRTNTNPATAFTEIKEFTFTSATEAIQKDDGIGLIDIENIQIQVEMSGNCELISLRLLP